MSHGEVVIESPDAAAVRAERRRLWCDIVVKNPSSLQLALHDADTAVREYDQRFNPAPVVLRPRTDQP